MGYSAIMAGAEGWRDIETYSDSKADWLKQHRSFKKGIPRRHTVARILRSVVAESLLEALLNWVNERRTHIGKPTIALARKVLRGSYSGDVKKALQLVTAYNVENMALFRRFVMNMLKQYNCGVSEPAKQIKESGLG